MKKRVLKKGDCVSTTTHSRISGTITSVDGNVAMVQPAPIIVKMSELEPMNQFREPLKSVSFSVQQSNNRTTVTTCNGAKFGFNNMTSNAAIAALLYETMAQTFDRNKIIYDEFEMIFTLELIVKK